jgi:hypothetical protein
MGARLHENSFRTRFAVSIHRESIFHAVLLSFPETRSVLFHHTFFLQVLVGGRSIGKTGLSYGPLTLASESVGQPFARSEPRSLPITA